MTDETRSFSNPEVSANDPVSFNAPRPFYWSIRRELWENRSVYLAPLIVAAIVLFASAIGTIGVPKRLKAQNTAGSPSATSSVSMPFKMAPAPIMLTTFLVGFFYCIDALYGERRDRSILFWKSLPVSDRTTVLSKASIPLLILPAIALALSVVTQILLVQITFFILLRNGISTAVLWSEFSFFEGLLIMAYGLVVHALWFAPIHGWLLLVSAWSKRAPILWAVLPLFAIAAAERIASGTSYFTSMLGYRLTGAMQEAFGSSGGNVDRFSQLSPGRYLSAAGLWVGLGFAVLCLAAAIRVRRNREPI